MPLAIHPSRTAALLSLGRRQLKLAHHCSSQHRMAVRRPYTLSDEPFAEQQQPDQQDSVSSQWRIGDAPEQQETGPATHIEDPMDPRLALYVHKWRQDFAEARRQREAIQRRALAAFQSDDLGCTIGLHFSWECLKRLQEASQSGRPWLVRSVLTSSMALLEHLELAASVAEEVFSVDPHHFRVHFQSKAAGLRTAGCSYIVAFPVSRPLAELQPPFLVLDGLQLSRNVGQILRTALHLGVTSVVASRSSWACLDGDAARGSMGWLYHMDFHAVSSLSDALHEMRELGVRIYAADSYFPTFVQPHTPSGDRQWALILGNEDVGISKEAKALSDAHIAVPQHGGESLNVAAAAAICLYELGRYMGK